MSSWITRREEANGRLLLRNDAIQNDLVLLGSKWNGINELGLRWHEKLRVCRVKDLKSVNLGGPFVRSRQFRWSYLMLLLPYIYHYIFPKPKIIFLFNFVNFKNTCSPWFKFGMIKICIRIKLIIVVTKSQICYLYSFKVAMVVNIPSFFANTSLFIYYYHLFWVDSPI